MSEGGSEAYQVVSTETAYRGAVVSLRLDQVRMSDGSLAEREVVEHPGSVGILALDDADNVVLVNQYRHPVRTRLDELPAGLLDVDGESALAGAQRELAEEAGLTAATWHLLLDLHVSPGISTEAIRIYLARDLHQATPAPDFTAEHEELTLTVRRVPLADAVRAVLSGAITNAAAVAGVLAADRARADGWTRLRPADAPWTARPEH